MTPAERLREWAEAVLDEHERASSPARLLDWCQLCDLGWPCDARLGALIDLEAVSLFEYQSKAICWCARSEADPRDCESFRNHGQCISEDVTLRAVRERVRECLARMASHLPQAALDKLQEEAR